MISDINPTHNKHIPTPKNKSLITKLLDDIQKTKIIDISTPMQQYTCSFNGYINKLYLSTKHNHHKRHKKLTFQITENDLKQIYIKQEGKCNLSGIHMTYIGYQGTDSHKQNKWNISVDRIDSTKGYTVNNIQLLCGIVNKMKTDMNDNELLILCNNILRTKCTEINKLILKTALFINNNNLLI